MAKSEKFDYKNYESLDSVFNYLSLVNKGLKQRRLALGKEGQMIDFDLPDEVEMKIHADAAGRLSIEINWENKLDSDGDTVTAEAKKQEKKAKKEAEKLAKAEKKRLEKAKKAGDETAKAAAKEQKKTKKRQTQVERETIKEEKTKQVKQGRVRAAVKKQTNEKAVKPAIAKRK